MERNLGEVVNGSSEKVKGAVHDLKGSLQDAGKQTADSAMKVVNEITSASKDAFRTYANEGEKQLAVLEQNVKAHPFRSIMLSAAAGILISRLLRR